MHCRSLSAVLARVDAVCVADFVEQFIALEVWVGCCLGEDKAGIQLSTALVGSQQHLHMRTARMEV